MSAFKQHLDSHKVEIKQQYTHDERKDPKWKDIGHRLMLEFVNRLPELAKAVKQERKPSPWKVAQNKHWSPK